MAVTVSANGLTAVHSKSGGKAMASIPDICKTPFPSPPGPLPLPYPNIAESKNLENGSTPLTQFDGGSVALLGSSVSKSSGDEMGSLGGVVSGSNKDKCYFLKWSPDTFVESRNICRKSDMMIMNKINTISMGGMDQPDINAGTLTDETGDIEIELLDLEGNPIPDEEFVIKFTDGSEQSGQTDQEGCARIEGVPIRRYKIRFPNRSEENKFEKIEEKEL